MKVKLPELILIPRYVLDELSLGSRMRLLFDIVPEDTYLDVFEMAEALNVHVSSIRRTLSDLKETGKVTDQRLKPVNLPSPPKEYRIEPLSIRVPQKQ